MPYRDLRDFMTQLEAAGELRRIAEPVSPHLEMTALADRVLREASAATCVPAWRRWLMYWGVRLGGASHWTLSASNGS